MYPINLRTALAGALSTLIVGCATQTIESEPEPVPVPVAIVETPIKIVNAIPEPIPEPEPKVIPAPVVITPEPVVEVRAPVIPPSMEQSIVYFDFDSSTLTKNAKNIITSHIQFLQKNPNFRLRLEGHADNRGEDIYNTNLARLRVEAIREFINAENVDVNEIELVSFGESKPAVDGQNFKAWRSNRRAIFVYSNTNNSENSASQKMLVSDE